MTLPESQSPIQPGQSTPRPRSTSRLPWIIAGVVALALLAGTALGVALAGRDTGQPAAAKTASAWEQQQADTKNSRAFPAAQRACDAEQLGTVVDDGGKTLVISGSGNEGDGVDQQALECIFKQVGMPTSVSEQVWATRALDGRVQQTWPGYTASWTYHPDSGLQMVIKAD
jgi:hypothetical protein